MTHSAPAHQAMDPKIFIMAKEPVPGSVKTRLCPPLSHEQAADLHRAFVTDT
ncbi:MAG: glycosyltransferase, partial [Deltaproteobacteria bacterium]